MNTNSRQVFDKFSEIFATVIPHAGSKIRRLAVYKRILFCPRAVPPHRKEVLGYCVLMLISAVSFCHSNEGQTDYLQNLLERVSHDRLYEDPYWQTLIHYTSGISGVRSRIDDPDFFLSAEGMVNPHAELRATVEAIFQEDRSGSRDVICKFIARYSWLKQVLELDDSVFVIDDSCEYFEVARNLQPRSASIVFPAAHMNSPASMFGHTLLLVNTPAKSKLLSHAVNYSASTEETLGLIFAFKGIFGLYRGYFSVMPYYEKVQEYGDIDQRDIWEYKLNLTELEVNQMLMHLWELKNIYSDYFFFSENCSYNLLFLLDAARRDSNLAARLNAWVIPTDTIKLIREAGFVESVEYRPSKATRIRHISAALDANGNASAKAVLDGSMAPGQILSEPFSDDEKIRILDLVIETSQYMHAKKKWPKRRYFDTFLPASQARSTLGIPESDFYSYEVPESPEVSHNSGRMSVGIQSFRDEEFISIGYRPAYHDHQDPGAGFITGAQIQFLDLNINYRIDDNRIELEHLDLIDIVSLSPRDEIFKSVSWRFSTGFLTETLADENHLLYRLDVGAGLSIPGELFDLKFGLIETELQLGGALEQNYSLGIGAALGILTSVTDWWTLEFGLKNINYELGHEHHAVSCSLKQGIVVDRNLSFNVELTREKDFGKYFTDFRATCNIYF